MPISKEIFNTGFKMNSEQQISSVVLDFLKKNNDKAYTADEISWEIKKSYSALMPGLKRMVAHEVVERKVIGRNTYYNYKGEGTIINKNTLR